MLNTDAYNPQVKKRMTKADFIKNNRGINANEDLPEEILSQIFDDIQNNEIRMKDEVEAGLPVLAPGPGLASAIANVGRDLQKEAYVLQSNGMANKTEVSRSRQVMIYLNHRTGTYQNYDAISAKRFQRRRAVFQCFTLCTRSTYVRSRMDCIFGRFIRTTSRN
jgi:brefeldin A-inhibited guanine nucleotide-exchange protein